MGNPMGDLKVSGQCFISNYKPNDNSPSRVATKDRFSLWFDNNRAETAGSVSERNLENEKITKNYVQILKSLASLAGDKKTLEYSDILALDADKGTLLNKYGIVDIKTDTYGPKPSGSARIILADGRQLRIDFKLEGEQDDYNSDWKKSLIKTHERAQINAEKMKSTVNRLKNDNKFSKKCDIELEKDKNGDYTGYVRIKLKADFLAGDLRNFVSKNISGSIFKKGLQKGAIKNDNEDLLRECLKEYGLQTGLLDDGRFDYDLIKIPKEKTVRINIDNINI